MISHICYVYIGTFLVDVHNIVYNFRIFFLSTISTFFIRRFLILVFCFNGCNLLFLIFVLWVLTRSNRGGRATIFCCSCSCFDQRVGVFYLDQGFRLDDLRSVIWWSLISIVIGLVCFHINLVSLSRGCCSTPLTVLLLLSDLISAHLIQSTSRGVSNCLLTCELRLQSCNTCQVLVGLCGYGSAIAVLLSAWGLAIVSCRRPSPHNFCSNVLIALRWIELLQYYLVFVCINDKLLNVFGEHC